MIGAGSQAEFQAIAVRSRLHRLRTLRLFDVDARAVGGRHRATTRPP
ncbi:MAG: hypothetical protein ABI083_11195 [Lapillicoccus sp.]